MPFFPPRSSAHDDDEYTVVPAIPMEDAPLHTQEYPFCYDETCGCHRDHALIGEVKAAYQDGLLTRKEATDFSRGRIL